MLFNSYAFILAFLPLTLLGFFALGRTLGRQAAIVWLVLASLFFYGWWNPVYLLLILGSMLFNYRVGQALAEHPRRGLLALGVAANLGLLGWFKYANFFVDSLNAVAGTSIGLAPIVLPLAISFFTFQQIAYLVDAYRGESHAHQAAEYALFVTFFPQLIAGPIVHHKEMLPQFMRPGALSPRARHLAIGVTIFSIGLFKKAVLADGIAPHASSVFAAAAAGESQGLLQAWGGVLAYTFQLYFDFSGYSDMAIGAARLFGIRLPLNFHSPYKSTSISEFWRRWHMTLSRFLRDYLYFPLGGNRRGRARRHVNLLLTMLLGGLWHGAGWTFVVWGLLHGLYLVINHAWRRLRSVLFGVPRPTRWRRALGWALTFLAVVFGWVFFRAQDFASAFLLVEGMLGRHGVSLPAAVADRLPLPAGTLQTLGIGTYLGGGSDFVATWLWIIGLMGLAVLAPNTQEVMRRYRPALRVHDADARAAVRPLPALEARLQWRPSATWATLTALLSLAGLLALTRVSEFLYFQF